MLARDLSQLARAKCAITAARERAVKDRPSNGIVVVPEE